MTPRTTNDVEAPEEEGKGAPFKRAPSNDTIPDDTTECEGEYETKETLKPIKRGRWIIIGAVLLTVAGLTVGLGVALSGNKGRGTTDSLAANSGMTDSSQATITWLFEKCTIDSVLEQDGYKECQQQCEEASCCATDAQVCDGTCLHYSRCDLLTQAGGSVPRAPINLEDLCNIDDLAKDALKKCMQVCEPAACCEAVGDENCVNEGNTLVCAEYFDICKPIYDLEGTLDSPPENLADICNSDKLSTVDGYQTCWLTCQPAQCCNDVDDSCLLENIIACGEWNVGGCYLLER